jgi:hypothetical protein
MYLRLWHHGLWGVTIYDMRKNLVTIEKRKFEQNKGPWKNKQPKEFLQGLARQVNTDTSELLSRYFLEPFDMEVVDNEPDSDDMDVDHQQAIDIESVSNIASAQEIQILKAKLEKNKQIREKANKKREESSELKKLVYRLQRDKKRLTQSLKNQENRRQNAVNDDIDYDDDGYSDEDNENPNNDFNADSNQNSGYDSQDNFNY